MQPPFTIERRDSAGVYRYNLRLSYGDAVNQIIVLQKGHPSAHFSIVHASVAGALVSWLDNAPTARTWADRISDVFIFAGTVLIALALLIFILAV